MSPTHTTRDPCGNSECEGGKRNRYYLGKRLTPAAFAAEQDYMLQRRRLLNRSIHGWGVVYGLAVSISHADGRLEISAGLALDRAGRELVIAEPRAVRPTDVKVLGATSAESDCWLLSVHYAERRIDPVVLKDECHCERHDWDAVCDDVVFSLSPIPCGDCCAPKPCALCCACTGDCEDPLSAGNRGPHACLCHHLTGLAVGAQTDTLRKVAPCIDADLDNGVPLACVTRKPGDCDGWVFDAIRDACGPRRLVKGNDLLFDLIRGCDLTVIDDVSWSGWHRNRDPVSLADFCNKFSMSPSTEGSPIVTDFRVHFSRPVCVDTLRPDAFAFTVIGPQESTGWGDMVRVPIVDIRADELDATGTHASVATLVVDGYWFNDELAGVGGRRWSVFRDEVSQVEIEVRGDYILDCNGQAVDADAVGLRSAPTGNGTPGGTYLSTFSVAPARSHS